MSKKIIIIEGTDNIGKDSFIKTLLERSGIFTYIHCGKPSSSDPKKAGIEQDKYFKNLANSLVINSYKDSEFVIYNRAWYGEYVYGTIYRNRTKDEVKNMIDSIEKSLLKLNKDIYYIQFYCDSSKLLHRNDDQKSLSNGDEDSIMIENKLFKEIFEYSKLSNKYLLKVNNGDEFVDMKTLHDKLYDFIYDLPWQS